MLLLKPRSDLSALCSSGGVGSVSLRKRRGLRLRDEVSFERHVSLMAVSWIQGHLEHVSTPVEVWAHHTE